MRVDCRWILLCSLLEVTFAGCSGSDDGADFAPSETAGNPSSGGGPGTAAATTSSGGVGAIGGGTGGLGAGVTGGADTGETGGTSTGGTTSSAGGRNGSSSGGSGGIPSGGNPSGGLGNRDSGGTGGFAAGGTATGGRAAGGLGGFATGGTASGANQSGGTGGTSDGGTSDGGTSDGGTSNGGTSNGESASAGTDGSDTGGTATGGSESGGTTGTPTCEYPEPPADVAGWIDESWNAELGSNIRGRSAWLLDNVMKGNGTLNLCVRWGATTAPSAKVKQQVGTAVEGWMNDWFTALGDYGCFPYGRGITVAVTGWAVRSGNESWVSDVADSIEVYSETDASGEPQCPDACAFFFNWDHEFPNCAGGDAAHFDYSIWVDDTLPESGAAAVGGDWGLRMPAADLENALDRASDYVIEHEIGHGFAFQDYYTWTGSTPAGGSLMIVGSTTQQSPTTADTWLVRRTWAEMQGLQGW